MMNNFIKNLPKVYQFSNLDETQNIQSIVATLKGISGVYAIINNKTNAVYLGSSINLGLRIVSHLIYKTTNVHLQNAISFYGLENFTLVIIELYEIDPDLTDQSNVERLLLIEQKYLDLLFDLPAEFRYNFSPTAGSTFGYKHTDETRAKKEGENNPNYGKIGASHPFYGKTHTDEARAKMSIAKVGRVSNRALKVYVYTLNCKNLRNLIPKLMLQSG